MPKNQSIFVIGAAGRVGSTAAFALAVKGLAKNIILIDTVADRLAGQAMDISHATAFIDGVDVRVGYYDELHDGDIVVVACGLSMSSHGVTSRIELLDANIGIIRQVGENIKKQGKSVFVVMVTNPVDILTAVILKETSLPKERVFGSGTLMDTARLKVLLAQELKSEHSEVDAYVLGEHGESSFIALSGAKVNDKPLLEYPTVNEKILSALDEKIRGAGHEIAGTKDVSNFGSASVITRIVEALQSDNESILPVCTCLDGQYGIRDVVLSLPTKVSSKGAEPLADYTLNEEELGKLQRSAEIFRKNTDETIRA